jgi:hypothetical protein
VTESNPYFEDSYSEELYRVPVRTALVLTQVWEDLKAEEKEQLTKITEALRQKVNPKLSLEAFRVVYVPSLNLSTWIEKPEKLIYFGPAIKGLNSYEVIEAEGTKMVLSESLSDLISSVPSRTKLWQALRQLFSA